MNLHPYHQPAAQTLDDCLADLASLTPNEQTQDIRNINMAARKTPHKPARKHGGGRPRIHASDSERAAASNARRDAILGDPSTATRLHELTLPHLLRFVDIWVRRLHSEPTCDDARTATTAALLELKWRTGVDLRGRPPKGRANPADGASA